ncbi:MAG: hypothetical protein J6Y27_03585 [Bacteroidales bacterium]|nr:hypothetical protein [Bacteroidales bacterium]
MFQTAFRWFGAFALIFLAGCSSRIDEGPLVSESIETSFALSVKFAGARTKTSTSVTQDNGSFRGIDQVYIVPFQTASAAAVTAGDARLGNQNVLLQNPYIPSDGLVASNNSHLYEMVVIPREMNRVLVYGKALDEGAVTTVAGKHHNGVLTPSGLEDPSGPEDISFHLEPVVAAADAEAITQTADRLIAALNAVADVIRLSSDAEIRTYLDLFAVENRILACSYQSIYRIEQDIMKALSDYEGSSLTDISTILYRIGQLQAERNQAGTAFPASYGIPEGAVGMWWNGRSFVRLVSGVNVALVPLGTYCYPPGLWYFANSAIKTSRDDAVRSQYKPQNATWGNILSYYTDGGVVESTTRSAAVVDQMQYGVALMELRFTAPASGVAAARDCPLTGIIVGEQNDVDFRFSPTGSAGRVIYDNEISGLTIGTTDAFVQTFVQETPPGQTVHFALEFLNNTSTAFPCQQGRIPPGCKFYLAGELNFADGVQPDGETLASVFCQDHKTRVNLRVTSLENAYNTVPDLRDPQLEIGVTAVMDWEQLTPGSVKMEF